MNKGLTRKFLLDKIPYEIMRDVQEVFQIEKQLISKEPILFVCSEKRLVADKASRYYLEIGTKGEAIAISFSMNLSTLERLSNENIGKPVKKTRLFNYLSVMSNIVLNTDIYENGLIIASVTYANASSAEIFVLPSYLVNEITGVDKYNDVNIIGI